MRGLYVHIPFCVSKCFYCDFYSLPSRQDSIASYIQALLKESGTFSPSFLRRDLKGEFGFPAGDSGCHSDVTQYQKNLVLPPPTPDKQEKLLYRETGESRVRGDSE